MPCSFFFQNCEIAQKIINCNCEIAIWLSNKTKQNKLTNNLPHKNKSTKFDERKIEFPIHSLNLKQYVLNPEINENQCIFDCYAIIVNIGQIGGGHQVTYISFFFLR